MKKILVVCLIWICAIAWDDLSSFIKGNASIVNKSVSQWLIKHTPKQ